MIKLYNTRTRKLEEFKPIKEGEVGIYSCGPTVYWNQHLGHMYAYTHWDTMIRFFRYLGFKVKWVMNITDVGHLTSDADSGDDKIEKGAQREGLTVWEIAEKYINQFKESMNLLNIEMPDVLCRATEHIQDQIDLIKKIEANGFTYKTHTGLVFDTSKFPGYADFGRLNLEEQYAGSRVEVDPEKKNPWDFLLWVTNQPTHIMQWDSPWGRGFPGWHIECTAMSVKYLGEYFDIHTGGKEHIPVHHTNEIAQGFGAFGHGTANFWLHNEWLTVDGEKMSKSKGGFLTVKDLLAKGYNPLAYRYLVLTSTYQKGLNFTWQALDASKIAYKKLVEMISQWQKERSRETIAPEDPEKIDNYRKKFIAAVGDNLNYPAALAVVWEVAKSDLPSAEKRDLISDFDNVLGLNLIKSAVSQENFEIPIAVQEMVKEREERRKQGKWEEADKLRRKIAEAGFLVEDTQAGAKLKPIQ